MLKIEKIEAGYGESTVLRGRETAVLLVEQSLHFASSIADYSYVLDRGAIVAQGNADELSLETVRHHLTV